MSFFVFAFSYKSVLSSYCVVSLKYWLSGQGGVKVFVPLQ